ncbi:MAG: DNA-3-methyladenine glycosylase I [archaeon]|nr:DNA-3-methyladenine glycosylase I [archaeon]
MVQKKHSCWGKVDDLMQDYHDNEWGTPLHDDYKLFEFLSLDGAQAGLSWSTILKKREAYRKAFDQFDFEKIAKYDEKKVEILLNNPGIVRNRLKVNAFITNAQTYISIRKEFGTFDKYLWEFVNFTPIQNEWQDWANVPSKTNLSEMISKDLKKRGFKFVGPVIIYAFMQAIGMVNDHLTNCYRYKELYK